MTTKNEEIGKQMSPTKGSREVLEGRDGKYVSREAELSDTEKLCMGSDNPLAPQPDGYTIKKRSGV
ncbi:MAG: hypothetical protein WC700_09070 [Gemmatimonadaceae bacterium]|jgi:hypothetical protein